MFRVCNKPTLLILLLLVKIKHMTLIINKRQMLPE